MKNLYSILFLLLTATLIFAQKTISGTVKNSDGDVIASASVTVEDSGKEAIIAYAITNSKGEYKLTFISAESTVDLKVKAFNHKPLVQKIKNEDQTLNLKLDTQATEIEEVKLKTKIITKRGDTITYDLKSFETQKDRTLADVLKNMPGIEVNKDGSILYQGQPLAKFYVNGKDLMEGGYGVITNSLPKDAVAKVEVMENHQPVKILQDKVPSDQAAINIKLKKNVTMTGRGEVASGFADPALWNVKLTPMFFGQKNQWVVNYKTNNTGEAVENEGNMFAMGNRWEGMRRGVNQNDWLNVESASVPPLPEKRYLRNNVHFVSANILTNPFENKEWELKGNVSYTSNAITREAYSEYKRYVDSSYTVTDVKNRFYTNKAKGELIFLKNAKKGFFKNTTTFTHFWNADRATALESFRKNSLVTDYLTQEGTESPTASFQNSLSTIVPWKEKMVNVMSFLNYQQDKQTLHVDYLSGDGIGGNTALVQDLKVKNFEARHSANISFSKNFWTFTPEVGFNFTRSRLQTALFGTGGSFGENHNNDLLFTNAVPYAELGINYKDESWNLFAKLPANFNSITAEDPARGVLKKINKVTFEPTAFAQYSFANFWKISASAGLNYNFGEMESAYAGAIMTSPKSLNAMRAENPLPETSSRNGGLRLEYRNPLNNLFFNVNYRLSGSKRNVIANHNFQDVISFTEYELIDNTSSSNTANAEIGKYFPKFKTNLALNFNDSRSRRESMQQNILFESKGNSQRYGGKFSNSYFSWLTTDYTFSFGRNRTEGRNNIVTTANEFSHNLSVYLYPKENHIIGFFWDQNNSRSAYGTFRNAFYDVSYQYSWAKKKVDFELKWLNIANRKVYERFFASGDGESFTSMKLRPSQVMLGVKFNFK